MPGNSNLGIQHNAESWLLALAVTFLWLLSVNLCFRSGRVRWQGILLSLFGFAWIGFGVQYVFRFVVISIDSVSFGNGSFRLANVPPSGINNALMMVLLFWATVCFGYFVVVRRKGPGLFAILNHVEESLTKAKTDLLACVAFFAILLATQSWFPRAFLTPVGLLGSLWIPAACLEWCRNQSPLRQLGWPSIRRWLYLLPGALYFYLNPYREIFLQVALIPFLVAIAYRHRIRFVTTFLAGIGIFLILTATIGAFREMAWGGGHFSKIGTWSDWTTDIMDSPWGQALRRFHSLDSLILTVEYVPDIFPYDQRNPLVEVLVRAFVPRALYFGKGDIARGRIFANTIWGYDDSPSDAMIAPSIVGDLYSINGPIWVFIGGLVWGLLLGMIDGWKNMLRPPYGLLILTTLGVTVAMGSELDFAHATATIMQQLMVLLIAIRLLSPSATGILPAPGSLGVSAELCPKE